jgi:LuxR family quorum sensing-dependent transcriptional regulator
MKASFKPAWDFLQNAAGYKTLDGLDEAFATALKPFEFDAFSCAQARAPVGAQIDARLLFGRSHDEWDAYYMKSGYLTNDPCIPELFNSNTPYAWSDLQSREQPKIAWQIWDEAAQAGARNGLVVPVPNDNDELYGVRLMSPEKHIDPEARSVLNGMSILYCVLGIRLLEKAAQTASDDSPLSPREAECLSWVTEGKSDWDISEILNISQWTVHEHIERAKSKLGVRSRIQAAMLSSANGWLQVNPSR